MHARLLALTISIAIATAASISSNTKAIAEPATTQAVRAQEGQHSAGERDLRIISADMKVVDAEGDTPSISWKVVVENETAQELRMMGKVQFLDSDDYVVDSDLFSGYVGGEDQQTFRGQIPAFGDEATKVMRAKAEILDYLPSDR